MRNIYTTLAHPEAFTHSLITTQGSQYQGVDLTVR